jgi:hypothetical protein
MRDLDDLLNSLVKIDRKSLIAILSSEAEADRQLVSAARERTASPRTKRREAVEHLARVDRILSFFQHGDIAPDMSEDASNSANPLNKRCARSANLAIRRSHKAAVELIDENGGGPGVKLRKPGKERPPK